MCIFAKKNSGFLHIPWGKFLRIQGWGLSINCHDQKSTSFLFLSDFSWNKGIWGNYSFSFIVVLSCYFQGAQKSGVTQLWAFSKFHVGSIPIFFLLHQLK